MKKILLFIIISSFIFPGMLHFEFGLSPKYTLNIHELEPDIKFNDKYGIGAGFTENQTGHSDADLTFNRTSIFLTTILNK